MNGCIELRRLANVQWLLLIEVAFDRFQMRKMPIISVAPFDRGACDCVVFEWVVDVLMLESCGKSCRLVVVVVCEQTQKMWFIQFVVPTNLFVAEIFSMADAGLPMQFKEIVAEEKE